MAPPAPGVAAHPAAHSSAHPTPPRLPTPRPQILRNHLVAELLPLGNWPSQTGSQYAKKYLSEGGTQLSVRALGRAAAERPLVCFAHPLGEQLGG